uniref:Uncharacterized protein n=1 Tax=Ciona savignyi TaxID=51511 RepID=H2YH58_CIOSA
MQPFKVVYVTFGTIKRFLNYCVLTGLADCIPRYIIACSGTALTPFYFILVIARRLIWTKSIDQCCSHDIQTQKIESCEENSTLNESKKQFGEFSTTKSGKHKLSESLPIISKSSSRFGPDRFRGKSELMKSNEFKIYVPISGSSCNCRVSGDTGTLEDSNRRYRIRKHKNCSTPKRISPRNNAEDVRFCEIQACGAFPNHLISSKLRPDKNKSRVELMGVKLGFQLHREESTVKIRTNPEEKTWNPVSSASIPIHPTEARLLQKLSPKTNHGVDKSKNNPLGGNSSGIAWEHRHLQRYNRAYRDVIERVKAAMKMRHNGMYTDSGQSAKLKATELCYDCSTNAHQKYTIAGLKCQSDDSIILSADLGFNPSCPVVQVINQRFSNLNLLQCTSISEKADNMENLLKQVLGDMYTKSYTQRGQLKSEIYRTVL